MKGLFTAAIFLALSIFNPAHAEYPDRPVKLIVPYAPGQTTDIIGRSIAQKLSEALGQNFYADNRAGASGAIGTEMAKSAKPDGYTLAMGSSASIGINPHLHTKFPYDPVRDFTTVALLTDIPQFLVTRADFPANNLQELIAHVRKNPGKLNFGSSGTGLTGHLTMEMLKSAANLDIVHIPYSGAPAAIAALIAGDTAMMFESGPVAIPLIQQGTLKVFAVGRKRGSGALPDVPSVDKAGIPGFDATTWVIIMAPAETPRPVVEKLNQTIQIILKDPALQKQYAGLGAEIIFGTVDEANAYIKSEVGRWGKVIKDANVKID
jgi:tripartite-type tricarboxylate transporter receptor subunit TctC